MAASLVAFRRHAPCARPRAGAAGFLALALVPSLLQAPAAAVRMQQRSTWPAVIGPPQVRPQMLMVGHRGFSYQAPENTLASINLAFKNGAAGVEFDVRRSADGELFLLHDTTLRRTASVQAKGRLARLPPQTYEELLDKDVADLDYWDFVRYVDVGFKDRTRRAFQRPVLLGEALAAVPDGRFALVELKDSDEESYRLAAQLAKGMERAEDRLVFIGLEFDLMCNLKKLLVEEGLGRVKVISVKAAYTEEAALEHIVKTKSAGLDGVDFEANKLVVTPKVVQAAHDQGLNIGVWVWDEVEDSDGRNSVATFHDRGITFFTSDMPPDVIEWMHALN